MLFARMRVFNPAKAAFDTHLNYIKRLSYLLSNTTLQVRAGTVASYRRVDVDRFRKLYNLTNKSIKKDIELARQDAGFAVISAPWFPVKTYYALYYLESVLCHLLDGSIVGFTKGGHAGVRKKITENLIAGSITFSELALNTPHILDTVLQLPVIPAGRNTRSNFWSEDICTDSLLKKLVDYKVHDIKLSKKWNLLRARDRQEKADFTARERVALTDFFYWYRIKSNYRDFDYIDFENGSSEAEVLEYLEVYFKAYGQYRNLLAEHINRLQVRP